MRLSPVAPSLLVPSHNGIMSPNDVENAIRKEKGSLRHYPNGAMVCVENTSNRGGGTVYPQSHLDSICGIAKTKQCSSHLDGARIFNAASHQERRWIAWSGISIQSLYACPRGLERQSDPYCCPLGDNQSCSQMEEDVWWRHAPSGYHCRSRDLCH